MAYDFGLQETTNTGTVTILDAADTDTCKLVNAISVYNTSAGSQAVALYYRNGGTDYRIYNPTVPAYGTISLPDTLVVGDGSTLRANSSTTSVTYSVRYAVQPYSSGVVVYDPVESIEYAYEITVTSGTSWTTVLDEPDSGYRHLIRTVTLANAFTTTPTTTFGIKKISTATVYKLADYSMGTVGSATDCAMWSLLSDGALILKPDYELGVQHSLDPSVFPVTVHYQTVGIEA